MRIVSLLPLLALLGCGDIIPAEGDDAGECSDAADNDQDGTFDCDDSDCSASPDCAGDSGDTGGGDGLPDQEAVCTEPVEPSCIDEIIQELSLHDDKVSDGEVSTEADGDDFVTLVDATAGGMNRADENPWTYVQFTQDGAVRVDIDDETALESMNWHLALHRFVVRTNSGDSGPSCVGVSEVPRADYADVSAADIDGADWQTENFYNNQCDLETDAIGGPVTAMSAWWAYTSCVETTMVPWLVQLEDGHVLKLVVESYYEGEGQSECNDDGSTSAESGWYTLRWQYLK